MRAGLITEAVMFRKPTLFLSESKLLTPSTQIEEAVKEKLSRHFSLQVRKLRPLEDGDLLKDPKLVMGLGPELRGPNSLSSAQVGLGVGVWRNCRGTWEGPQNSS